MTDVRLTALNPIDSQVYPVACNTSGELLVADGGPDLTVTGNLTVDGTASFNNGDVNIDSSGRVGIGKSGQSYVLELQATDNLAIRYFNGSTFKGGVGIATNAGDLISTSTPSDFCVRCQNNLLFSTGGNTARLTIDSSGSVTFGTGFNASSTSNQGLKIDTNGAIFNQRTSTTSTLFKGYYQNTNTVNILADGSATFAGDVTAPNINSLNALVTDLETKMSLILRQIDISAETP